MDTAARRELRLENAWAEPTAARIYRFRTTLSAAERTLRVADPTDRHDLDLADALLGLPERHAAVIQLHHLEDRPVADVARRLGCSIAAAKVLLFRARNRMAERLTGLSGWALVKLAGPVNLLVLLTGIGRFVRVLTPRPWAPVLAVLFMGSSVTDEAHVRIVPSGCDRNSACDRLNRRRR